MPPRNPPPPAHSRDPLAPTRARSRLVALLAATALCAGCGGGLTGVWASTAGRGSLEFQVVGKRVIVAGPNGAQVYTRGGDLLDGGYGTIFVKAPRRGRVGTRTKS